MSATPSQPQYDRASVLAGLDLCVRKLGNLSADDSGVLAQVWVPVSIPGKQHISLQTKGSPFCLNGTGEELALFRARSCDFIFETDLRQMALMGSPGRVFRSGEAETAANVQRCGNDVYLRVQAAEECGITCTILLPVFANESRKVVCAVLEVTPFAGGSVSYQAIFGWARANLESANLYTIPRMEDQAHEMQSHFHTLRLLAPEALETGPALSGAQEDDSLQPPLQAEQDQSSMSVSEEPFKALAFQYTWPSETQ